jgi:hypothetical protein
MTQSQLAVVLSIALSVVWLVPARGAPLAPTKPSQIVTLQPDVVIGTPPCSGVQLGVRQIVNPDLTTSLLTIPDKQVLVVTSGTWRTGSAATPADRHLSLRLFLKTARPTRPSWCWVPGRSPTSTSVPRVRSGSTRGSSCALVRPSVPSSPRTACPSASP